MVGADRPSSDARHLWTLNLTTTLLIIVTFPLFRTWYDLVEHIVWSSLLRRGSWCSMLLHQIHAISPILCDLLLDSIHRQGSLNVMTLITKHDCWRICNIPVGSVLKTFPIHGFKREWLLIIMSIDITKVASTTVLRQLCLVISVELFPIVIRLCLLDPDPILFLNLHVANYIGTALLTTLDLFELWMQI